MLSTLHVESGQLSGGMRVKRKTMLWLLSGIIVLGLIVAGCGGSSSSKPMNVNIATATTGGVYYPLGNAMAQLFNQKVPNVKASAQATAGTPQNILLMQKKEAEIAFAQNGVAYLCL